MINVNITPSRLKSAAPPLELDVSLCIISAAHNHAMGSSLKCESN